VQPAWSSFAMPSTESQLIKLPASLEDVRVKDLPIGVYYISDFISESEEASILDKVCHHFKTLCLQLPNTIFAQL
jgi:hypothetical protein